MTSKTFYPNTLSQSSESNTKFRQFTDLNNVKNSNSNYAISKSTGSGIASKSGTHNRPSTITAKNFQCNVPTGSKITKITCEYATCYTGNISIAGPTVDLINVSAAAKKGKALTKTMTKTTLSWSGNFNVSKVNSSSFGVTINFPANTKSDVGKVKIQYIRLIVEYTAPNFTLSSQKVSGEYTGDEFAVKLTVSNKGQTSGGTNVKITLPSGVSYVRKSSGDGSISNNLWTTNIGSKLSATITFVVKITTDGDHNLSFKETSTSHTNSLNLKSVAAPSDDNTGEETKTGKTVNDDMGDPNPPESSPLEVLQVGVNEEFSMDLSFQEYNKSTARIYAYCISDSAHYGQTSFDWWEVYDATENVLIYSRSGWVWAWRKVTIVSQSGQEITVSPLNYTLSSDYLMQNNFKITTPGEYIIIITDCDDETIRLKQINISVRPSNLSLPHLSMLKLSSEELNRLGEVNYNVKSWLKIVSSESYVRDWLKNFRIGVFNNEIESSQTIDYDSLTVEDIFENAAYWSDPLTGLNTFEEITCNFEYDEDYPVYIILTGDYPEGNPDTSYIQFTNPTISENETNDNQCIFPVPIKNIVSEGLSELSLDSFESSNSVLLYDLDSNDVETTDTVSITGFQVNVTVDSSDNVLMLGKLINQNGVPGERSIQIRNTSENRVISLGGPYDLWGFDVEDMVSLDDWKVEISFTNLWSNTAESVVTIEDVELVFYVNKIRNHLVKCYVNGKDTRHYGMFIQNVVVPSGLKTNVDYLDVKGSDNNDALCQTIEPKEIAIDFKIIGCTFEETTAKLQRLGKLFSNIREDPKKPIPNKLEFSNYPGQYWNVIMESPIDHKIDVSNYEGTIKLTVPDGTSWSTEDTVTGVVGYVSSIAKINPVITILPEPTNNITVSELESKQNLIIHHDEDFVNGDVLELDCRARKLVLQRFSEESQGFVQSDISGAIDWHSDFFSIIGEYHFDCTNGLIQTVAFTERW